MNFFLLFSSSLRSWPPTVEPAERAYWTAPLAALQDLRIVGLMTIPPPGPTAEASRVWFRRLRELRDALNARPEWGGRLRELSMGRMPPMNQAAFLVLVVG